MKTKEEILDVKCETFKNRFLGDIGMAEKFYILSAMKEYGEQEYQRGVEEGKEIEKHGTTTWQE